MKLVGHISLFPAGSPPKNGQDVTAICGKRIKRVRLHITGLVTCSTCAAGSIKEHNDLAARVQSPRPLVTSETTTANTFIYNVTEKGGEADA